MRLEQLVGDITVTSNSILRFDFLEKRTIFRQWQMLPLKFVFKPNGAKLPHITGTSGQTFELILIGSVAD